MSAASLLDLQRLTAPDVETLFSTARTLSNEGPSNRGQVERNRGLTAALVFFENSTRTRLSFETACHREGLSPIVLDANAGSSLEKGETYEDTVLNIAAMDPSVMVVRCGDSVDLAALSREVKCPIVNAGWGRRGHPTQALLDAYTIFARKGGLKGQRVLIVGDVRHSRVAASHFELARVCGYEVALCGPPEFLPENAGGHRVFGDLAEGLKWATVAMALRVQLERHSGKSDLDAYHRDYGFRPETLRSLAADALILHPGPINHGVEMVVDVMKDPRAVILDQVRSGVWIRQALLRSVLERTRP